MGGLVVLTHGAIDQNIVGRIVFAPVINPIANFRDGIIGAELWSKSLAGEKIANFFAKGFKLEGQFVQDLVEKNYDPIGAAALLTTPLLIKHGLDDVAVPIQDHYIYIKIIMAPNSFKNRGLTTLLAVTAMFFPN